MSKELIISANVHEKKVAVLEDGVVTEFYVERRDENQGVVGNLYKGRVMKVLPGMQSAFVDIGLERDAFLYVSDFTEFMEEEEEIDFREVSEEQRAPARIEDRARRGERPRPERVPAIQPIAATEPAIEDLKAERPVSIEDAVEQLAEIAHESLIPPPPPEEELPEQEPAEQAAPAEAQVERVTDQEESAVAAERIGEPPALEAEPEVKRGRGRRKKTEIEVTKPKRRSSAKADEKEARAGARKTSKAAGKRSRRGGEQPAIDSIVEAAPQELGPQFERVTDEDVVQEAGELLKDAIVQEKIIEQVHTAEFQTLPQPEPEWRVGSHRSIDEGVSAFQRVVDENTETVASTEAAPERGVVEQPDEGKVSPFRHISDVVRGLYDRIGSSAAETSEPDEPTGGSIESQVSESEGGEALGSSAYGAAVESSEGRLETSHEEDREAEVRERYPRAEFAARRGGRGRRGRGSRRDVSTAAAKPEEEVAETPREEIEVEEPQPSPPRPVEARPDHRRERRPNQRRPDPRRMDHAPSRRPERGSPSTISDLLHEGQEIVVQIAKEPIAKKGARITSHIALPGRFIVYMPTVNHIGVSRKIPNEVERMRLKRIVTGLRDREGATGGFIARTACAGHSEQELADDIRYLLRTWSDLRKKAERVRAPSMVHRDLDLVQRILRDQLSEEFAAIRIDSEVEYARIVEFVNRVQPKLVKRVKLYTSSQPILEKHGVQAEIDKAVRPRVWLKSGGYIVINQTEALVAIDVNTGKFVGKSDKLEDTITRTNLEAAKEIVRQVRLRDLGGIIVIDFIDMEERKNRQKVMMALQQELSHDRAPSKILSINDFGLVAITRKRVKQSLERTLCAPCPYCSGAGMVKSAQTMCFEILEQAKAMSKELVGASDVMLRVSPNVAESLRTTEHEVMEEIEANFGTPVAIEPDPHLHQEQFDFAIV
ncbi:MAG TPA: Rne/Rng family ribonuclease [Blastocatellia bacterium]